MNLPDRRKDTYEALETRLDEHMDAIDKRLHRRYRNMLIAFALIGVTSFVALGLYGLVLHSLNYTRATFVRTSCEATNARHNNAVNALIIGSNADIRKVQKGLPSSQGKVSVQEIRNRVAVTIGLLDALAPVEDCNYKTDLALGKVTPTPTPKPLPQETPIPAETP